VNEPFVPGLEVPGPAPAESLCFAVRAGEVLVVEAEAEASLPALGDLGAVEPDLFLGAFGTTRCYAVSLQADTAPPAGMAFQPLRPLAGLLDERLFRIVGRAVQLVEWDETHRFCGRCGSPTERLAEERARRCQACGHTAYPRIAPAVIVRITRGEELLLARGRRWTEPMYSLVAGFVDPGESLEETVAREVREEVGIDVDCIRYLASQPWPFPHSLMLGFEAEYAGGAIRIAEDELMDAGWYSVAALPPLPPQYSIARRLIDEWVTQRGRRPQP
jgi:NAD+ diphosphatase